MDACFDLSGFTGLSASDLIKYQSYWNTFDKVQAFNTAVSTIRASGQANTTGYYQFISYKESNDFTAGRILHIRRYPDSNWAVVQQN
jgi:hypothetical protein